MVCDRCGESISKGYAFCPYCGQSFHQKEKGRPHKILIYDDGTSSLKKAIPWFAAVIAILLSLLLIFETIVMVTGIGKVMGGFDANPGISYPLYIVTPFIVEFISLTGTALKAYYLILIAVAVVCVVMLFVRTPRIKTVKDKRLLTNPLFEVAIIFSVCFLIEMAYIIIVNPATDSLPKNPDWANMFLYLSASVWEEVITRFLMIGVPVAVVYAIRNKDSVEIKNRIFGGFDNFSILVVALMVLSSGLFAAAHVTSGTWGVWKIFPTFLFGMIAAYLFVKYGLYASIALHFLNDYLQAEVWITGNTTEPVTVCILLIVSLLAIPFVYVYGKRIVAFFKGGFDPL